MKKALLILGLSSCLAAAVWADFTIHGKGDSYGTSQEDALDKAYHDAEQNLEFQCDGPGDSVRDIHTDEESCSGSSVIQHCHVVLGAECHFEPSSKINQEGQP